MFSIHLRTGFSTSQSRALLLVASSLSHYFISQRNQVCSQSLNFSGTWRGGFETDETLSDRFYSRFSPCLPIDVWYVLVDQLTDVHKLIPTTWERLMGVLVLSVSISLTVQTLTRGKRQNAVGVRDLVALFIMVVPIAVACIAVTTGDLFISTVQGLYWRETLDVRLVFWIFF